MLHNALGAGGPHKSTKMVLIIHWSQLSPCHSEAHGKTMWAPCGACTWLLYCWSCCRGAQLGEINLLYFILLLIFEAPLDSMNLLGTRSLEKIFGFVVNTMYLTWKALFQQKSWKNFLRNIWKIFDLAKRPLHLQSCFTNAEQGMK